MDIIIFKYYLMTYFTDVKLKMAEENTSNPEESVVVVEPDTAASDPAGKQSSFLRIP